MDEADKIRLRKNQASLLEDLRFEDVMLYLMQEDVLTDDDTERIKAEKTRRDRVQMLLNMLPYRGSQAYKVFREALLKDDGYTWIVEAMDNTDVSSRSDGPPINSSPIKELNHKVFKRVSEHLDVIKDWKNLGRALGIEEPALQEIEYANSLAGPKEMAYQVLIKWHRSSTTSDPQLFVRILREHGYKYLADDLEGK